MSNAPPLLKPAIILLVEDEDIIRWTAAVALEDAGFVVIEAGDASEALEHLTVRAEEIVLIVTDVHMPGEMNGIGLAHHAFGNWPWIGVVVTSGKAHPLPGDLPPTTQFLPKPYELDALVSRVEELTRA
jgi:DNA-binding NtrC family response regulator